MRTITKILGAAALATLGCGSVQAEDAVLRAADHNGAPELARGDYAKAERVLAASLKVAPNDTDLLLNQALLLQRTGRSEAARAVFRQVLAQGDEAVTLRNGGSQSAHVLARAGLQSSGTFIAVR